MNKRIAVIVLFLMWHSYGHSQIRVSDTASLVSLVQDLQGPGLMFSNITTDCEEGQYKPYGRYIDTSGATGLTTGLLLTTGAAQYAQGPNNASGKGQNNSFDQINDPDLLKLIDTTVSDGLFFDVCKVEFDVSIYSDTLTFNYVFGSEEYPEFVGDFHDVFGFFISGPSITDTINIALIPGTNEPVSVSTVNHLYNSNYYVANGNGLLPPFSIVMQYDGFTKLLQAKVNVIPCETYHIKLIIADEGDGIYDSGIFLESGSFKGSEEKITTFLEHEEFKTSIEGCNKQYFTFHRVGIETSDMSQPVGIKLQITGTAINGVDYTFVQDSITIPPYQDSINLVIDPLLDGIPDAGETVIISIINDCPALPAVFNKTIVINEYFDFPTFQASVCQGDGLFLNSPSNTEGYSIQWNPGQSLDCYSCVSPYATPDSSGLYGFTLTEPVSGCRALSGVNVVINPIPDVFFTYSNDINYTNLDIFFQNQTTNADMFFWSFGDGDTSGQIHPVHTYPALSDGKDASYLVVLSGTNSITGCSGMYSEKITISNPFFLPNIITPNNDLANDEFTITGIQPNIWRLRVYNRWGRMVHKEDQYNNRWSGDNVPDGTYYFDLTNPMEDRFFKGFLQVVR